MTTTAPSPVSTPATSRDRGPTHYIASLDGVRAIAVIAVIVFHLDRAALPGGYLGVSVFFTLSGFVVTGALLRSSGQPMRSTFSRFYSRRALRLLPASAAVLVGVAVGSMLGVFNGTTRSEFRWTAVGLNNWYQLTGSSNYDELLERTWRDPSPLLHYWSLAIEEQYYLVWPVVFLLVVAACRGRARAATPWIAIVAVALSVWTVWTGPTLSPATVYWNPLYRAPELLFGAVAGLLYFSVGWRPRRGLVVISAAGVVAAIALTGSSAEAWPYRGLLPVFAVVSAVAIVGAATPGTLASALERRPLVWIGRVSYGAYLYHWPVFVAVDHALPDGAWFAAAVKVAITMGLAALSYSYLELPFRQANPRPRTVALWSMATIAVLLAASLLVEPGRTTTRAIAAAPTTTAASLSDEHEERSVIEPAPIIGAEQRTVPTATTAPAARAAPTSMLVVGDSTADGIGAGLAAWADQTGAPVTLEFASHGACGLVRGGDYVGDVSNAALHIDCGRLHDERIPTILEQSPPDVVVVHVTLADTWDRSWDGGSTWLRPTDPEFRQRIQEDYDAFFTAALDAGVPRIVWLRPPTTSYGPPGRLVEDVSFSDGSQDVIAGVVGAIRDRHPDRVEILEYDDWVAEHGLSDDPDFRPDGTHLSEAGALRVATDWLGPTLCECTETAGAPVSRVDPST